jgi:hypothetical protein
VRCAKLTREWTICACLNIRQAILASQNTWRYTVLRLFLSFLQYPSDPPRSGEELRMFIRRWVGPALTRTVENTTN